MTIKYSTVKTLTVPISVVAVVVLVVVVVVVVIVVSSFFALIFLNIILDFNYVLI